MVSNMSAASRENTWQWQTAHQICTQLIGRDELLALVVIGSLARQELDPLSDLDLVMIVKNEAFGQFFPERAWLGWLGVVLGYEQHGDNQSGTHRLLLGDGRRIDLIVLSEPALEQEGFQALWRPSLVLFSRSQVLDRYLQQSAELAVFAPLSDQAFAALVDGFWYRASVASLKVGRNDLLIGLHLCCGLIQDLAVLVMVMRDRAESSTIHRTGGTWNALIEELHMPANPPSRAHLLSSIDQSCQAFDHLALQWSSSYQARYPQFKAFLHMVERAISQENEYQAP
jgi:hypothetical protein